MSLAAPARKKKAGAVRVGEAAPGTVDVAARLLAWYDESRRDLPWRARRGERGDPYRIWLSEVMLQQTTVAAVIPYHARFLARFPTVGELAAAGLDEVLRLWAGLGYYARARNLHACARMVIERHAGEFPPRVAELRALPGIGDYTAAAVAAIAFDAPVVPVDGNVERVVARMFAIGEALPGGRQAIRRAAETLVPVERNGDFAQALMDLGAMLCTPKGPDCPRCPLRADCVAHARGDAEKFPVKKARQHGRLRRGAAFVAVRADGCLLVRTRPATGLLGGMTEVPTTDWSHGFNEEEAPADAPALSIAAGFRAPASPSPTLPRMRGRESSIAGKLAQPAQAWLRARREGARTQCQCRNQGSVHSDPLCANGDGNAVWRRIPGTVTHVFTHFPLELVVFVAHAPADAEAPAGMRWAAGDTLATEALPSLMRKVIAHAGVRLDGCGAAPARRLRKSQ